MFRGFIVFYLKIKHKRASCESFATVAPGFLLRAGLYPAMESLWSRPRREEKEKLLGPRKRSKARMLSAGSAALFGFNILISQQYHLLKERRGKKCVSG